MDLIPVIAGVVGGVLMWSALKNKNPLEVIQLALQGQPVEKAKPLFAETPAGATALGSAPVNGGGPI